MDIKVERVGKYRWTGWGPEQAPCMQCGKVTGYLGFEIENSKYGHLCRECRGTPADHLFPVAVTFRKNLRNSLGMGNHYFPQRPSSKFFDGLSGHPARKERIDFHSHTVYMTEERAQKEGYLS